LQRSSEEGRRREVKGGEMQETYIFICVSI
jgi:hypothetical protein